MKRTKAVSNFLLISENREFSILWVTHRVMCSFITSKELVSLPVVKEGEGRGWRVRWRVAGAE